MTLHVENLSEIEPRTQKAKGIKVLQELTWEAGDSAANKGIQYTKIISTNLASVTLGDCEDYWAQPFQYKTKFLRPCPITPQHGFVDSRKFTGPEVLFAVIKETVKADPDGEVLITRFMDAKYSAVLTDSCLTIGHGTDGVTSGKGNTITMGWEQHGAYYALAAGNVLRHLGDAKENYREQAGLTPEQGVMLELLWYSNTESWAIVQARGVDANVITASDRYIPRKMKIERRKNVHWLNPMELAKQLNSPEFKQPGILFFVENMRSHQATQLIEAGLPVISSTKCISDGLKVGNTVEPTKASTPPRVKDIQLFSRNLRWTMAQSLATLKIPLSLACGAASNMAKRTRYLQLNLDGDRAMLAIGIRSMIYLSAIACIGEVRHSFYRTRGGMSYRGLPHKVFTEILKVCQEVGRNQVYDHLVKSARLPQVLTVLAASHTVLSQYTWRSGYGGAKWANIAEKNITLYKRVRQFVDNPDYASYHALLSAYNIASYTTHNGGRGALSKMPMQNDHLSLISGIGIILLKNPIGEKEGKLPRLRPLIKRKKLSRIRRFPLFPEGYYPKAFTRISIIYHGGKYQMRYLILFMDTPWNIRNTLKGSTICGEIDLTTFPAEAVNVGASAIMQGVTLTKNTIQLGGENTSHYSSPYELKIWNVLLNNPMHMLKDSRMPEKDSELLKKGVINATYKYFVGRDHARMYAMLVQHAYVS